MPNFSDLVQEEDREYAQRKSLVAPFEVLLKAISIETEVGNFTHYGNKNTNFDIIHPYVSPSSWIRAQPEAGTNYVATFRTDQSAPQLLQPFQRGANVKIGDYREGYGLYRPLYPGELELSSFGTAQLFLTRRPIAELRGGTITRWADQDKLTAGDRAPLHHKQFLQNRSNQLIDEQRTGIVTRPKSLGGQNFSTWERIYPKVRNNYTAEDYIHMQNPANESPEVLFTRHSGHVLDNKGNPKRHTITRNALRHIEEYFANDDSVTAIEIDENGNYALRLATAASEGMEISIPTGNYVKTVEFDETITVNRNHQHTVAGSSINQVGDSVRWQIGGDYHLKMNRGQQEFMMSSIPDEEKTSFTSKSGHTINIDDTVDAEEISVIHKTGAQFNMSANGSVKLAAQNGMNFFMDTDTDCFTFTGSGGDWFCIRPDEISLTVGKATIRANQENVQVISSENVVLQAPKCVIQGSAVELGNLATLSVALAEPLALLFDSHIHATSTGPSSPPIPPNTAALLNINPVTSFASDSVKVKANLT